jgi:formylmethanofuran dehydrogenase subunit A
MSDLLKISGGTVYDPMNGLEGEVRDLWIRDARVVPPPQSPEVRPDRIIDASGLVVMPGGVDIHCHVAGPKTNMARKMRPEERRTGAVVRRTAITRSGTLGSVPSTFATGYRYAGLGYTTAFDAAIPPLAARHAHEEFGDTPCIDKGFFVLMGNNHYVMQALRERQPERLRGFVAWLLSAAKAYGVKIVNPGGVEAWKQSSAGNAADLDYQVGHFDVTPRQIIAGLAAAVDELQLPHPVHVHPNNLGLPGNWNTTLETMKSLEGHRGHIAHIQFHSYGGGEGDETTFNSKTVPLVDYVNRHENITVDVGQVLFGGTTSMTGDGPLGYYLHKIYGTKWFSGDIEHESGCGIVPIEYKNKSLVHTIQWAIGLEWFLLVNDPWRIALSTDHPNGGSFLAYPQIIRLLMDRTYRRDVLKTVHPKVRDRAVLGELDREYSLTEICIITRAAPARMLGLRDKGHLAPGAVADVTIYSPHENPQIMFELPRYVIKSGEVLVEDGEIRQELFGDTHYVSPEYDSGIERHIAEWFDSAYSVRFRNYPVDESYLRHAR